MIATRYYLDTNPIGSVSLTALTLCIAASVLVMEKGVLAGNWKTFIKLLLPATFVFIGIMCTPHKFVTGEHVMGKIVCYVFCIAISLDLVRCYRGSARVYGILATLTTILLGLNMVYQLVVLQRFYHVFAGSPFEHGLFVMLLVLTGVVLFITCTDGFENRQPIRTNRFTVLELICLIFAIGLIAVLVPLSFRMSREKARRANCGGNLKSMSLALLSYSGDYGGFFPEIPVGNSFVALDEKHTNDLPNSRVYGCPSANRLATMAANSNYWYVGSGLRDDITNAKDVRLAMDGSGNHPRNAWVNVAFVDGHVSGAKPDGSLGWNDNNPKSVHASPYGAVVPTFRQPNAPVSVNKDSQGKGLKK